MCTDVMVLLDVTPEDEPVPGVPAKDEGCMFRSPGWIRPPNTEDPFHYLVTLYVADYPGLEKLGTEACQAIIFNNLSRLSDAW